MSHTRRTADGLLGVKDQNTGEIMDHDSHLSARLSLHVSIYLGQPLVTVAKYWT